MRFRTDVRLFIEALAGELDGPYFPLRLLRVTAHLLLWIVVGTLLTIGVFLYATARWVWTLRHRHPMD